MSDQREYFISYNTSDAEFAGALSTALTGSGISHHIAGRDLPNGIDIPTWMDRALSESVRVITLCSPDYFDPEAKYCEAERAIAFWADPAVARSRLVPIEVRPCAFTPPYAELDRIPIAGMQRDAAIAHIMEELASEAQQRRQNEVRAAAEHPDIFRAPRIRMPEFTGYFRQLAEIHATLSGGRTAAVIQTVAGLGGAGKTMLAAEYAHRFGTRGRYGGVWWVNAEDGMLNDLAVLGATVGLPGQKSMPDEARAALAWLGGQERPWLVIYDDVPDADAVRDWLPTGSACTLITSRRADFADLAEMTNLDQWDLGTTVDYLLVQTGRDDRAGAEVLAGRLDGLPLAASQSAAFLRSRKAISFHDYAEAVEKSIQRASGRVGRGGHPTAACPTAIYATFSRSIETLPPATQDLLCLLSWLSPEGVEEALLIDAAHKSQELIPDPLGAALRNRFGRFDLVAEAVRLSLMRTTGDERVGQTLIVNRVVQAELRAWQRQTGRAGWDAVATVLVSAAVPLTSRDDPSTWEVAARLLPHARELARCGPSTGEAAGHLGRLLNQAGRYLHARDNLEGAITFFESSVEMFRAAHGEESRELAFSLGNLCRRYTEIGRYAEAEQGFLRCLAIEQSLLGPDHPETAIRLKDLCEVYWIQQWFDRAEPLLQWVLDIERKNHGEMSHQVASSLGVLGTLHNQWAEQPGQATRRDQARAFKEDALGAARAVWGERHHKVSHHLHKLGLLYARLGDFPSAADLVLRAAAIMASLGLAEHPHTQERVSHLLRLWDAARQGDRVAQLEELLVSEVAQVEAEMMEWVEEDPEHRDFGPPSMLIDATERDDDRSDSRDPDPLWQRPGLDPEPRIGSHGR